MERAVLDADKEWKDAEIPQLIAMHRLLDLTVPFDKEYAKEAHHWATRMYPELAKTGTLTPDSISKYASHLRETDPRETYASLSASLGLYLQYHSLYPDHKATAEKDDMACAEWIKMGRASVSQETQGPPPKSTEVSTDLRVLLSDHIEIMQKIVDVHRKETYALVDQYGSATCGDNLNELWEKVAQSPDAETAKQFALQASRYFAQELVAEFSVTPENLEGYIKVLKKIAEDLAGEEGTTDGMED